MVGCNRGVVGDTTITMWDLSKKPISEIKAGDEFLAYDESNAERLNEKPRTTNEHGDFIDIGTCFSSDIAKFFRQYSGILFELLTRQVTVDVLNNENNSSAIKILKEFFNKKTQLGKEYELYRVLTVENYTSEIKANHLVDAVVKARQKLNGSQLKREKYNCVQNLLIFMPSTFSYIHM